MSEGSASSASADVEKETDRRAVLAETIARRADDIERRWVDRVAEDVAAAGKQVDATDLRDSIGEYLIRLARAFRGPEAIEISGAAAWSDVAREHAVSRVRLGFDIDELVREF